MPGLSDVCYCAAERKLGVYRKISPVYRFLALGAKNLEKTLTAGNYNGVVCTHIFGALMMTGVRNRKLADVPCFFVATDYGVTPLLDLCDMEGYFIPAEDMKSEFLRLGISDEKLIASGIPVHQEFHKAGNRENARKNLNLPPDWPVVLLMCGSLGCGPIRKIAKRIRKELPEEATLVVICGRNERLFVSMSDLEGPGIRVLGFSREIARYMDAADLIVTKPGGLSATEAANKHLPMVFLNTVGGCEERNFERFINRGYAWGSKAPEQVVRLAVQLVENPQARSRMAAFLGRDFVRNSALIIAEHVIEICSGFKKDNLCIKSPNFGNPQDIGGCDMEFMQSQTRMNLARSFAGESQARTRYTIYAKEARKEGNEWIARVFEETAANEAVHAEEFLELIQKLGGTAENIDLDAGYPFLLGDTAQNLNAAANGELEEYSDAYPGFAEIARREGFDDAARLWLQIARIEGVHHNTFKSLHSQLTEGTLTEKKEPITWRCLNCGYTYEGIRACDPCPVCHKSAGWQEGQLNQKQMMKKNDN